MKNINSPTLINGFGNDDFTKSLGLLKIISKNFLSIRTISKDLKIINENLIKFTQIRNDKQSIIDEMLSNKEKDVQSEIVSTKKITSPQKIVQKKIVSSEKQKSNISIISNIFDSFSIKNILKGLKKIALPALIITTLWQGIEGAWEEWKKTGDIWESFKSGLGQIVEFFTFGLIDKKMVGEFLDKSADFLKPITDAISSFFSPILNLIKEKFDYVSSLFVKPLDPKKSKNIIVTKDIEENLKLRDELQRKSEIENLKRLELQKNEEIQETIKIRRLQKEKQYEGDDEIVRQRLGLPPKTETMKREERIKYASTPESFATYQKSPSRESKSTEYASIYSILPSRQFEPLIPTPTGDDKWIMSMIKKHEGVRTSPYKDTQGLWTVGVGHLIGDGKTLPPDWNREFSMQEIDSLFARDYEYHKKLAEKTPGYDLANEKGRAALIDLTFNMGGGWFKKFKNAAQALANGDFEAAANELINSKWFKQVGNRAATIVAMIRDGLRGSPSKVRKDFQPMTAQVPESPSSTMMQQGGNSLGSVVTLQSGVNLTGLNPEFARRVAAMAEDFKNKTGKKLLITSGVRTNEEQKKLWDAKVAQLGGNESAARKLVAEPMAPLGEGKGSFHLKGLALDINTKGDSGINKLAGSRNNSTGWLESFGLTRPVVGEDWHIQPTGLVPTPDNPMNPGSPILVAGKNDNVIDVSTGKKESLPTFGAQITTISTELSSQQRYQQQKRCAPAFINAPTNNNQIIIANRSAAIQKYDPLELLLDRMV